MIIPGVGNQKVVEYVTTRFRELKDMRKTKEAKWMECVRAYMSDFPRIWDIRKETERRSARYVPLSFDAVETLESTLMSMLMPNGRWIDMQPAVSGKLEYDDVAASEMEALIYNQHIQMRFKREFKKLLKQMAIVGNAPYQMGWRQDLAVDYPAFQAAMQEWQIIHREEWMKYQTAMEEWRMAAQAAAIKGQAPPPKPQLTMPEPPPAGGQNVAYAGPTFQCGDIFNFVVDPFSPDRDHPVMIKRSFVPRSAIIAMAQRNDFGYSVYENVQGLEEREIRISRDQEHMTDTYDAFGLQVPSGKAVEIKEAWGTLEIPYAMSDGREVFTAFVATVANDSRLIRFEPTFLWSGKAPVGLATYRDVPGQVYGVGALEMALGVADLVNARTNQNIDIVNYAVNPEYKAVDDGFISPNIFSAPSKIHWVGNIENLVPLQKDLQGIQISMQDVTLLKNEFKMITKSGAPLSSDSSESATKTRLDARMLGSDIGKIAEHIEETALWEIITKQVELNSQYLSREQMVRGVQKGSAAMIAVSPQTARMGWGIVVKGTKFTADQMQRAENLMMFQQLVLGNPMALPAVNVLELLKMVYEELGFSNADQIFNDEATAMDIINQMIQFGLVGSGTGQSRNAEAAQYVGS